MAPRHIDQSQSYVYRPAILGQGYKLSWHVCSCVYVKMSYMRDQVSMILEVCQNMGHE